MNGVDGASLLGRIRINQNLEFPYKNILACVFFPP